MYNEYYDVCFQNNSADALASLSDAVRRFQHDLKTSCRIVSEVSVLLSPEDFGITLKHPNQS